MFGCNPLFMLHAVTVFVLYQFQAEFKRICPTAKDMVVEWEDMSSTFVEWAHLRTNSMVEELITELNANGKPTLGKETLLVVFGICE
jgi:hypothetical protein